jgi:type I restriction enzyme M protein
VFSPCTNIETNLLFFDRSQLTVDIWFYEQLHPEGVKNYTKTRPMIFDEFVQLQAWWDTREENDRAWKVPAADLMKYDSNGNLMNVNLDVKNPSRLAALDHLPPVDLVESITTKERAIAGLMDEIMSLLVEGM